MCLKILKELALTACFKNFRDIKNIVFFSDGHSRGSNQDRPPERNVPLGLSAIAWL